MRLRISLIVEPTDNVGRASGVLPTRNALATTIMSSTATHIARIAEILCLLTIQKGGREYSDFVEAVSSLRSNRSPGIMYFEVVRELPSVARIFTIFVTVCRQQKVYTVPRSAAGIDLDELRH
jgi:hypothetical protein